MTVTDVTIPTIKAFCNLEPKAQALNYLDELANRITLMANKYGIADRQP